MLGSAPWKAIYIEQAHPHSVADTLHHYQHPTMADVEYSHDDFEVVRTDARFGGFEELKLKNGSTVSPTCNHTPSRSFASLSCSILGSSASQ